MDRAGELTQDGDKLFEDRGNLLSLWQAIAEQFRPERADFTTMRDAGDNPTDNLTTSFPIMACRDLGNSLSAMLRPPGKEWFQIRAAREDREDYDAKVWLQWATGTMRRAMYDRVTGFVRATKEGDHDFAAFGQCVISVQHNRKRNALLYQTHHLRDVVWRDSAEGMIAGVHRRWEPYACDLVDIFGDRASAKARKLAEKPGTRYERVKCRHIVLPSHLYDKEPPQRGRPRPPFVSIWLETEHKHIIEEVYVNRPIYVIPRWQTQACTQYAHSPATMTALPDARLIQAMALVLQEAGEKAVDPPMIAVENVLRSDLDLRAGRATIVERDYDERLGEALRPLTLDLKGIPIGMEMMQDIRNMLTQAFYLNRLTLPPTGDGGMSELEVGQRVQEYIRGALPLLEPMETEYNGALCEESFGVLLDNGAFGSPDDIPQSLQGSDVQFRFESPLTVATEGQKPQKFKAMAELVAVAAQADPGLAQNVDGETALRDAIGAIAPARWLRDPREVAALREQAARAQQGQALLAGMHQTGAALEQAGKAAKAMKEAA